MLILRLTDADGSNPIVLEGCESIQEFETVNSADEGISFEIGKNHPKASYLNPAVSDNYSRIWEVWDTITNERENYGPISSIEDNGSTYKVSGPGRSGFLDEIKSTNKTFYAPVDKALDNLRYENLAIEPRTGTIVYSGEDDEGASEEQEVFDTPNFDDTFYKLSKFTKDNVIDDENGLIPVGKIEPPRGFFTTKSYWSGTDVKDTLIVDLGQEYPLSKLKLLFPWWGGKTRANNRSYDFDLAIAPQLDDATYWAGINDQFISFKYPVTSSGFVTIYQTGDHVGDPNRLVTYPGEEMEFNLGTTYSGAGYALNTYNVALDEDGPISARFIRVAIKDTHAWYSHAYDDDPGHDGWDYQCLESYSPGDDSFFGNKKGIMRNSEFNDQTLEAANDCHASIVEIGAFKEIVPKDVIKPLALQRIDHDNLQIKYFHVCDPSETRTVTKDGINLRRFEPGTFFRRASVTWSGATGNHHKFFKSDCSNCYPDGYHFGVVDSNQNAVLLSDDNSGTTTVQSGIYSRFLLMRGDQGAVVNNVDAWRGQSDHLSHGGGFAWTDTEDDYCTVHFRGQSFKWYATIPESKTGAQVSIEIREKSPGTWTHGVAESFWSSWTTLEASYQLPNSIHGEVVYEIGYNSGILNADTVYEIRITNLDGGFCSVDSFEGYWEGSFTMYNEDATRIKVSDTQLFKQIYDKRFSEGSMYKWNAGGKGVSMVFEGDRIIVLSAKGRNHGKMRISMRNYNNGFGRYDSGLDEDKVYIPGGEADGSLIVDLHRGKKGNETAQYVIFDSDLYFTNGLPWNHYGISVVNSPVETYEATKNEIESDSFRKRCHHCKADNSGKKTINKYVYLDAIGVHEATGLSVVFNNETNLKQIQSITEALQTEWTVNEEGLRVEPIIGIDTDYALREGENTLVDYNIVYDVSKVATILYSTGADIDGLPLFTITEDKKAREVMGRTIMRDNDFREIGSYEQLIGLSRTELRKRREPEKRITVTHLGDLDKPLRKGDIFNLVTRGNGTLKVRIIKRTRSQTTSGTTYELECTTWPQIV